MGCLKGWRGRKERFETKIGQAGKKEKKDKKRIWERSERKGWRRK